MSLLIFATLHALHQQDQHVSSVRTFIAAMNLPPLTKAPEIRRSDGSVEVRADGLDFMFFDGSGWPTRFSNMRRRRERMPGGKSKFATNAAAQAYAVGLSAKLKVPRGAVLDRFDLSPSEGEFMVRWVDAPPTVAGKRLFPLNVIQASFDTENGVLRSYAYNWGTRYARPVVKLTPAQAEAAANRQKPVYLTTPPRRSPSHASETLLVWAIPTVDPRGDRIVPRRPLTARVAYQLKFGYDYIKIDAETGRLLAVEMFR